MAVLPVVNSLSSLVTSAPHSTVQVTHLIAGQVGSTKYSVARELKLPVLLPSWVEACWEEGFSEVVFGKDDAKVRGGNSQPHTSHIHFNTHSLTHPSTHTHSHTHIPLHTHTPTPLHTPTQLSAHRCLPFTGCTITVTGIDEKTRRRVSDLCQQNGGTYSGELTKDICTHLIVGNKSSEHAYTRSTILCLC